MQLVAKWSRREKAIRPFVAKATREATKAFLADSKTQMRELIYDKPIPTRAQIQTERKARAEGKGKSFTPRKQMHTKSDKPNSTGSKPAWKRTGNLRRSEKMRIVTAYVGIVENAAQSQTKNGKRSYYARYRHDKKNTRYPAPWRKNAINRMQGKVRLIYRKAIRKALTMG